MQSSPELHDREYKNLSEIVDPDWGKECIESEKHIWLRMHRVIDQFYEFAEDGDSFIFLLFFPPQDCIIAILPKIAK